MRGKITALASLVFAIRHQPCASMTTPQSRADRLPGRTAAGMPRKADLLKKPIPRSEAAFKEEMAEEAETILAHVPENMDLWMGSGFISVFLGVGMRGRARA